MKEVSQGDGSVAESTCCPAWGLDSDHQHPHVAMRIYNLSVGMKVGTSQKHASQPG